MARAPVIQDAEVLPEADRLEGFPHPRETPVLIGHEAAERELAQTFASGRMHHAWLIAGREGIGKATLAYRLARHVLARPEARDPAGLSLEVGAKTEAARQVRALSHPGLLVLRRPYDVRAKRLAASILIDEVRRLRSFLGLTGGEGAWRVVVVDSADELNINAANALLKSLEEPPRRALFLLISSEPSKLLPTIRSRCRRLDLAAAGGRASARAAEAALAAAGMEPPAPTMAAARAPRRGQRAAGPAARRQRRARALRPHRGDFRRPAQRRLAGRARALRPARHHRAGAALRGLLQPVPRPAGPAGAGARHGPQRRSGARPGATADPRGAPAAWAELWQTALRERDEAVLLNLDRKALILGILARLEALARA